MREEKLTKLTIQLVADKNKRNEKRKTKNDKSEVVKDKKQRETLSRNYPGGDSAVEPPETIPNSEVKRCNADGSVGFPHVRVGHRRVTK